MVVKTTLKGLEKSDPVLEAARKHLKASAAGGKSGGR